MGYLTTLVTITGDQLEIDERNNRVRVNNGDWYAFITFEYLTPVHVLFTWPDESYSVKTLK